MTCNSAVLKQLFDAHATLEFVGYKKYDKCTITTYKIASLDHPVEAEDDECVEIYDKGSLVRLFEYVGKTKFFKHCILVEKKYKDNVNYVAAKAPEKVILQDPTDLDAE